MYPLDYVFELDLPPTNDQGLEPKLQMIICQDAPQVCQVNKIIFLLPRKSEAS